MLDGIKPYERPKMIFTTGQQASGKSILSRKAMQRFVGKGRQAIAFSRDDLRRYDPNRAEIFATRKSDYSALTAYNASYWRDKLIEEAAKRNVNIVFEAVLKDDRFNEIKNAIMIAKQGGYRIQSWALAVHENVSLYSMFNRYEDQIEESGEGDVPPHPKNHDEAYKQFPRLVVEMMKEGIFDKSIILDRSGKEYYNSAEGSEVGYLTIMSEARFTSFENAMQIGRQAFYDNPKWKHQMRDDWKKLIERMEKRHASSKEMTLARTIMERCLSDKNEQRYNDNDGLKK